MNLKTVTWNIGGGRLLEEGRDPAGSGSYTRDGLEHIVKWLKQSDPDIIALQEVEGTDQSNQIAYMASRLGYVDACYDATSRSHMDQSKQLGNGIISRFPLSAHRTGKFHNPHKIFNLEGRSVQSHDKGYSTCSVRVNENIISTTTLHLLPFRVMEIELDSETASTIFSSVTDALQGAGELVLIQGDFNIDAESVGKYFPTLFGDNGLKEIVVETATTPKGRKYDHVLYKGLTLTKVEIDSSVGTDHYPVICHFEIAD